MLCNKDPLNEIQGMVMPLIGSSSEILNIRACIWDLTKHMEQVKSRSSLTESKSSQESDGLPSLSASEHPSNNAGLDLTLVSLKLM